MGVIWRRRSGRTVYYRMAEKPGNRVTAEAVLFLQETFKGVKRGGPRTVAEDDQRQSKVCSDAALFAFFTSFTHPRRLQVVRYLAEAGECSTMTMAQELSMSLQACHRHVAKLVRRGIVEERRLEGHSVCNLVTQMDAGRVAVVWELVDQLRARRN